MTSKELVERMRQLASNHPFRTLDPWAEALRAGANEIEKLEKQVFDLENQLQELKEAVVEMKPGFDPGREIERLDSELKVAEVALEEQKDVFEINSNLQKEVTDLVNHLHEEHYCQHQL